VQQYRAILIDVLNIFHANTATNHHLTTTLGDGSVMHTGGIYGTIRSLKKLERERLLPGGHMYFLADVTAPRCADEDKPSNFRLLIDPEYKANRKPQSEAFYAAYNLMMSILRVYSSTASIVCRPGFEADDMVKPVLEHLVQGDSALLVSGDSDWARSISPSVQWLHHGEVETLESYSVKLGYDPTKRGVIIYKAFRGDGDNIPKGVLSIPESLLLQIVNSVSSIQELIDRLNTFDFISQKWKDAIFANRGRLLLNERLIDFLQLTEKEFKYSVFPTRFESEKLRVFYTMLGFDVEKLDPRLPPKTPIEEDPASFFKAQPLDRA
jgi:5'-3' exonuclease